MTTDNLIIGALLKWKVTDSAVRVTNTGKHMICADDGTSSWHHIEDYEPVDLTAQMLESVGWIETEVGFVHPNFKDLMLIKYSVDEFTLEKDFGNGDWNKVAVVKYFHELQVAMKVQGYTI